MSPPTEAKIHLLGLPREVRFIIYEYVMALYDLAVLTCTPKNQPLPLPANRQWPWVKFVRSRSRALLLTCRAITREVQPELPSYFARSFFSGVLHLPDEALDWDRVFRKRPQLRWIMPMVTKFSLVAFWAAHDPPQQTVFPNLREVTFYCPLNKLWKAPGFGDIVSGSLGEWNAIRDAFIAIEERANWPVVPTVRAINGGARCETNVILAYTARTDDGSLKQRKIVVSLEQPPQLQLRTWALDLGLADHIHLDDLPAGLRTKADRSRVCHVIDERMLFEYIRFLPI